MSIHSDIKTALVGVSNDNVWPEAAELNDLGKIDLPMVLYIRKSREPLQTLLGPTGDVNSEFVFECYAKHKMEALTLADEVRAAILAARDNVLPIQYEMQATTEDYTPETMEYMEPVAFGFWHT